MNNTISVAECTKQVRQMGRMFGLLFHHFAKTIVEELGDVKGKKIIHEAVYRYGFERGQKIRQIVKKKGLALTLENLAEHSDLPNFGWESDEEGTIDCCYAQVWQEKGSERLGILYCDVDFAVLEGYNPTIKLKRLKNVLQGDTRCKYKVTEKRDE